MEEKRWAPTAPTVTAAGAEWARLARAHSKLQQKVHGGATFNLHEHLDVRNTSAVICSRSEVVSFIPVDAKLPNAILNSRPCSSSSSCQLFWFSFSLVLFVLEESNSFDLQYCCTSALASPVGPPETCKQLQAPRGEHIVGNRLFPLIDSSK